jgi:hypothetical protein
LVDGVAEHSTGSNEFGLRDSKSDLSGSLCEIHLNKGMHKIEIAAESQGNAESKAEIFIKTIVITGIDVGGAAFC